MKSFKQFLTEAFSKDQIDKLKAEYGTMQKIDPTSPSYKKLIALLDNLPQDHLKQLASADIKFISPLAKNRIKKSVSEADELDERCWDGYKPTPGKKPYEKGSCMKEDEGDLQEEAEHEGKKVTLNKPFRTPDGPKKFAVYVKNDRGNVVKVTFGDPNMEIKRDSDDRRANFRARHNCEDPGPKWKARYWSCKMWSDKPVSKITEEPVQMDQSQAAKLFQKFLRTTGAPDKVAAFTPKSKSLYAAKSSKFSYFVDLEKRTVTSRPLNSSDPSTYVWSDKTNSVKVSESKLVKEESPPDAKIEKWIKDNKNRFKNEYGDKKGTEILYAKAWKMYNSK